MKRIILSLLSVISVLSLNAQTVTLPYQNTQLTATQRADDLL